jgi:arsenate reductase (glutaredoxin)
LAVAEAMNVEHDVVLYMKQRPDRATLEHLVSILEDPVEDLVRNDSLFKKLELNRADFVGNPAAVVDILVERPALLQRPVVVRGERAIIGRPKDRIAELLG